MLYLVENILVTRGLNPSMALALVRVTAALVVLVLSFAANYMAKRYLLRVVHHFVARTKTTWDDVVMERRVFHQLAHVAPALIIYLTAPYILAGYGHLLAFVTNAVLIYLIALGVIVLYSFLDAVVDIYRTFEIAREIPIKGFIQVAKIVIMFIAVIAVISIIFDQSPFYLFSGLGALTAVLMLIFKDSILGLVAGIQLTSNKMVARGDWIEMPKYGADGDVIDISLTTVKVKNWDKTITSIPAYALISESFKNWRGMAESGGRRIKRSINIDMNTIKFCDEEMLRRFAGIRYIAEYIERKKKELDEYNAVSGTDHLSPANIRRLTNIGTFRAYIIAYLKNHPMINRNMTFLVRQLQPGENGLPLEIYVFSSDIVWANYEAIQADIFDHILAVVPEFDLRVFQNPSGSDFMRFAEASGGD